MKTRKVENVFVRNSWTQALIKILDETQALKILDETQDSRNATGGSSDDCPNPNFFTNSKEETK